jgi:leader peptidase (prepilin peptidase)/N-methyltransferase
MVYYFAVISFLLGLVVGSFLNVVVHRLPQGESLSRPSSRCPQCKTPIRWRDNIPVVSWLILRGRCRDCGEPISLRYPLVEAGTAVVFLLSFWRFGLGWSLLVAWAFIACMISVALIDHDHMIIPDKIVLPGALIGLVASIALDPSNWWKYLAACLGAAAFMLVLAMVWPGGMGPGDVKMALFMGAVLGVSVTVAVFVAFLTGAVVGVLLIATHRRKRKDQIPFGPYLALGSIMALLGGQAVLQSYLSLF